MDVVLFGSFAALITERGSQQAACADIAPANNDVRRSGINNNRFFKSTSKILKSMQPLQPMALKHVYVRIFDILSQVTSCISRNFGYKFLYMTRMHHLYFCHNDIVVILYNYILTYRRIIRNYDFRWMIICHGKMSSTDGAEIGSQRIRRVLKVKSSQLVPTDRLHRARRCETV